jgi:hypothetical protein
MNVKTVAGYPRDLLFEMLPDIHELNAGFIEVAQPNRIRFGRQAGLGFYLSYCSSRHNDKQVCTHVDY